jgi:glycolate oxidase FAD binding subunit
MGGQAALRPADEQDLIALIGEAAGAGRRLELRGGGSKAEVGARRRADIVDLRAFRGVVDYDPAELVVTVRAGTPLAEVEALVHAQDQMLAFEPFDHGPLFGRPAGAATIGGVVAAGVSGSRRLSRGAVRDHLLGFRAVSGRGEAFVGGAKVVKNVTGYDLPKLAAGSWGRLFALTEVTLKVLPRPREATTLWVAGLGAKEAVAVMALALGSQADVAAAAHDPSGQGTTAIRLEGIGASVQARAALLERLMSPAGAVAALTRTEAEAFWRGLHDLAALGDGRPLWRISAPARHSAALIESLARPDERWLMDWGGALTWLASDAEPAKVREAAAAVGGHAMLVRAPESLRDKVPAFQTQPAPVMALEARLRRAFDPQGVFEMGRFLDQADAD